MADDLGDAYARLLESEREARRAAERAAERTQRLYQLAVAIGDAVDRRVVAEAFVAAGREALGAQHGVAFLLDETGTILELCCEHGQPSPRLPAYHRIPVDAPLPVGDVVKTRKPQWFASEAEAHAAYPATRTPEPSPFQAWAVVPLVVGERGIGAATFSFGESRAFPPEDQQFLKAMTRHAALALERCRLFEAERRATAQARLAERRKDEFLAMLGHELRNPLAPLATAVELMRARDPQMFRREREVIERQVAHLSRLLDDLLDISKITRGKVELEREVIPLADVIAKAVEMASPLYEKRQHHLQVDVARTVRVSGDAVRLAQVFQNLLTNAAKYTPPGGHVSIAGALEDGDAVVRVTDDGVGIPPDLLGEVFELFVQGGERSLDRSEGGLGIGLTVVKRLVELHGGEVSARSDGVGRGTEMTVRLPAADSVELQLPASAIAADSFGQQRRILIVDDNVDAAEVLGDYLRERGFVVELAGDGPTALAQIDTFVPHAAVLDIGLPVMDGYELALRLRERWPAAQLRLIAVTGYGQDADRERSRAAGFDEHLVKPVDLAALERALAPD
jgi:signal transduction histidine kinase